MNKWKLVPVEPTKQMHYADATLNGSLYQASNAEVWEAMLAAAPEAPVEPIINHKEHVSRGDILRCKESDDLCVVWAASTDGSALVKWKANDFSEYTKEQLGELFWVEPLSKELEDAALDSDNYAAFLDGVRFANLQSAPEAPAQEPVAWMHITTNQAFTSEPPAGLKARCVPLYTAPQPAAKSEAQTQWQGLTHKEISTLYVWTSTHLEYARAIEAKLREKNRTH